jgi:predicted RNA-binding Zn-ribbon protein involved in translation (DUF1610 family)
MTDNCPNCGSSWLGEEIPERIREHYSAPFRWRREVRIEPLGYDRWTHAKCPDCGAEFAREALA